MADRVMIGDSVLYTDQFGVDHHVLLTNVFDNGDPEKIPNPSVNVVLVSPNADQTDTYGRQIARNTSVVHKTNQYAAGMYWRRVTE